MSNYKPYREYKDSKVSWLTDIPKHWEIKRLKFAVNLIGEKLEAESSELSYIGLEHIDSWSGKLIEDGNATSQGIASRFRPDDVLFGKLRPYLAKVHLARHEGLVSTEALVLRPSLSVHAGFLRYYMISRDFIRTVDSSTYGSKMPRASWNFIGNLPILLPEDDEQKAIARFLDFKTSQIDALVAQKETFLKKLAEKRMALINHTVTKGLDPQVQMKDSGVEWLGRVPEHWDIKRLKNLATYNDEALDEKTDPDFEMEYVDISSVNLVDGITSTEITSFENAPSRARRKVRHGDTIISTVRTYLKAIAAIKNPPENLIVSTGFAVIRPITGIDPNYLSYLLQSEGFVGAVVANSVGVSYPAINASVLAALPAVLPPTDEQQLISRFLDAKTIEIDNLISKVTKAIEKLKEYRLALITQAVTGKIDVRQVRISDSKIGEAA